MLYLQLCQYLKILWTAIGWAHNLKYIFKYFDIYHQTIKNFKKLYPNSIYELDYDKFVNNAEMESKNYSNTVI